MTTANPSPAATVAPAAASVAAPAPTLAPAPAWNGGGPPVDADAIPQAYQRRIEELREYGVEDDVELRAASEQDFWAFVGTLPSARKASLVLTDDGNLRAVWDDGPEGHLGLQFLGGGQVQYVIFKQRRGDTTISRVAGVDSFADIKIRIDDFGLNIWGTDDSI